jgi:hypothetical protein
MIAANYLKHPEALRFQRELFHNGFKNSPRIMRLMECVFKFAPDVPQWAKDAVRKARKLVKLWKGGQLKISMAALIDTAANQTIPTAVIKQCHPRFTPCLTPSKYGRLTVQGSYRSFCQAHNNWAADRIVYQYAGGQ